MLTSPACPIITLEEHYWDAELVATFTGLDAGGGGDCRETR